MNLLKPKTAVLRTKLCCLSLCLAGSVRAADAVDTTDTPLFGPGKEYHVVTDNDAIGKKRFNLWVPRDYTDDRDWPVIFRYKGRGEKYNPIVCRGGRSATCDRGAIVVGMAYFETGTKNRTPAQFIDWTRRQLKSIYEVKKLISQHLRVDDKRLFLAGSSAGGWLTSLLLEYRAQAWAGAMIYVAGRHSSASYLSNDYSTKAFRGLPVFFGSSLPGDSHGENYPWARQGAAIYQGRGAIVTFQVYTDQWLACSPLLRDWVRAYVLDGGTDSIEVKRAKWQNLTRKMPHEINSREIIKAHIAEDLNKRPDQLTDADLLKVTELSLMGQYVSDISYLTHLTNLESLDISFTYVDTVKPLLRCKNLRRLDISDTHIEDIAPLKDLPQLGTLAMWNLWLDRKHIDALKAHLPNLEVVDYQWDLYEKDDIGRVVPKLKVTMESPKTQPTTKPAPPRARRRPYRTRR